ncbi:MULTISPECIES: hypothetical protein [unclassified Massilia]|uniref:hypothetical protein n=1 Tax=unclassified Massilia TaxID=2609279 RepID=UPI0009E6FF25|nr:MULTISPECIES: hypothetical protein [unclassified Massilia]
MSFLSLRLPSPAATGALLLLSLAASACSTPQERAAQKQAEMANMMTIYGPACSRLGYAVDSDQWRNCILSLSAKDELVRYGSSPGYYPGYWRGGYWGHYW